MKKIHRFITSYKIEDDNIIITDHEIIHQIKNVLKLKQGEGIILANKNVGETRAQIKELTGENIKLTVIDTHQYNSNTNKKVILYMAILKNENFELVVQKASEIGITKIVSIITERTVKTGLKHERLVKIATEASELSGRIDVPEITEPMKLDVALIDSKQYQTQIIFDAKGEKIKKFDAQSMAIFVGPEGGFTDEEIDDAQKNGCLVASLGQNILRGETAGIIASYLAYSSL